ncbi:MAG: Uracil DNA glycosylase superfamily protein [Methanoregulaceae archaeon PtaB.Bin056]|nr:MAG: Uracil DNA glycosylase superfamily protein [Methanoregulaceae archaeon PtaB.Bin056]
MSFENPGTPLNAMTMLAGQIGSCRKCALSLSRIKTVPGEGPAPCRVMLIGEGPGKKEDESGRPFVGRAGAILSDLLARIDLSREEVFITSVVKCRPPKNRAPVKEEIAACMPFLDRQIAILSPEILVPMGRVAASAIFSRYGVAFPSFSEVRGKRFSVNEKDTGREMSIIPVYHPAVITHNPPARAALEEDFIRLGEILHTLD